MQAVFGDIQAEATRRAKNRSSMVSDEVEWDLNMRSADARLAPFVYRSAAGASIEIIQRKGPANEPGAPHSGTGTALWTAAVGLAKYIEARYPLNSVAAPRIGESREGGGGEPSTSEPGAKTPSGLVGRRCLELGCGTGLVSLVAASLGASVVATDIPEIVEGHAQPNIDANLAAIAKSGDALLGSIEARSLVWGETNVHQDFEENWDLIVASDVIYRATHVPLLLQTLEELMCGSVLLKGSSHDGVAQKSPTALIAFDKRGREGVEAFLKAVAAPESCFTVRHVSADEMPPGARFTHFGCAELTFSAAMARTTSPLPSITSDADCGNLNDSSLPSESMAALNPTSLLLPDDAPILPGLKTTPPLIVALAGAAAVAAAAIDLVVISAVACPEVNGLAPVAKQEQQTEQLTTTFPMDCPNGICE